MIVRGGTLVTTDGLLEADLAIEEGRITTIAPELAGGASEIDARGLTILPGLIDDHVHFNEPGNTEWEGAASGSRALAAGGGTVFFDMPLNSIPCTVNAPAFREKRDLLSKLSMTDFGLWGGIVPGNRLEMEGIAEAGAIGFKAFMADSGLPEFPRSDYVTLFNAMREAARLDLLVAVHAERNELVRYRGNGATVRDYLNSRPVQAEVDAIRQAADMAGEAHARLHIVHVSSGRGVAAALEARARGVDITIETCPHYLYFTEEDMVQIGALAKCAPPLRPAAERDSLWDAVVRGDVDIIGSDHSPAPLDMKIQRNFFEVWGGIAGIQSTLAVLLNRTEIESAGDEIEGTRRLTLTQVAALVAGNPARRFQIANKGQIALGFDADLTLVDLSATHTVTRDQLFQRHGLSPYLGNSFRGVVRRTLLRGETIFADGKIVGEPRGRMVTHAKTGIHA